MDAARAAETGARVSAQHFDVDSESFSRRQPCDGRLCCAFCLRPALLRRRRRLSQGSLPLEDVLRVAQGCAQASAHPHPQRQAPQPGRHASRYCREWGQSETGRGKCRVSAACRAQKDAQSVPNSPAVPAPATATSVHIGSLRWSFRYVCVPRNTAAKAPICAQQGQSQACSCCRRPRRPRALKPHPAVARARSTMLRCTASCAQGVVRAEAWRRRRRALTCCDTSPVGTSLARYASEAP